MIRAENGHSTSRKPERLVCKMFRLYFAPPFLSWGAVTH